jgi:hypothetical protein
MTEYNYTIGESHCGGDFVTAGCAAISREIVIYKKDTPTPNLVDRLKNKKSGTFETKLEMRNIKIIMAEKFYAKGEWNPDYMFGDIPLRIGVEQVEQALNSKYLDNYIFTPELLF